MNIKEIKDILKMSKEELLNNTVMVLQEQGYNEIFSTKNYTYAKGEIPILLVAHCDTVHKQRPKTILDDRCGVIAIYEIIKKYKPYILFTQDEEIGGVGAKAFCEQQILDKIKFAIEIDRRGNNQAVFYDCGNEDLQDYICNKYGFDLKYGSFTDVCFIGETFDVGIVNLSAGYYNEHQEIEYICFKDLYNTIKKVEKILEENIDKYFDYQEVVNYYNIGQAYSKYIYQEEKDYDELNPKEWKELYGYEKPKNKDELYKIIFYYLDY